MLLILSYGCQVRMQESEGCNSVSEDTFCNCQHWFDVLQRKHIATKLG